MLETDTHEKLNKAIKIVEDYLYFLSRKPNLSYCTEKERGEWEKAVTGAYTAFVKIYYAYKHELQLSYTDAELAFFPPEDHKHFFAADYVNTYAKNPLERRLLYEKLLGGILTRYHRINCKAPFLKIQQVLGCLKELRDSMEWNLDPTLPDNPTRKEIAAYVRKVAGKDYKDRTIETYIADMDDDEVEPIDRHKQPYRYPTAIVKNRIVPHLLQRLEKGRK